VSWDQPTRRSPIDEEGNDAQAAKKKTEVALEEHTVLWYVKDDYD
jgi:hypothetical protein